ncbi:hypothetical protein MMC30_007073 [Trapelia coarctata]|nr:hypothetical protein [Trapelia coarctata]
MTHRPLRKSQLIAFDNAVAGHDGVLSDPSGELIVKPCKQPEIEFYQSTRAHPDFAYYTPTFLGTLSLGQDSVEAASSLASQVKTHSSTLSVPKAAIVSTTPTTSGSPNAALLSTPPQAWTPSGGQRITTDSAIVLENVSAGLRKPNTLDVKLGARLWADDAPPQKRQKLDDQSDKTTSRALGLRIAGMKTWLGPNSSGQSGVGLDGYKAFGKEYGRAFNIDTVKKGFEDFFFIEGAGVTRKLGRKVIRRFLDDLRGLQGVLEKEESRMYSASVLFVYEGDGAGLEEDFEKEKELLQADAALNGTAAEESDADVDSEEACQLPKIQAVKMIDFAHAAWTPEQGPDENVLFGIRNLITILDELTK